ncbi:SAR2788 family putative toxin [Bacillus sp. FSL W8-0645]|uniref:SAR2788 family putative toxin n=1 Tax=Bacillus TaxID=1386 RepID=UPI0030F64052
MWLKVKSKMIILLVFLLVASLFPNNHTKAEEIDNNMIVDEEVVSEMLEDRLSEENISVDNFEVSSDELVLDTSMNDAEGNKVEATLSVEPGADSFNLTTREFNEVGEEISKEYEIKVNQFKDDEFEATFEDVETEEVFTYNSEEGTASFAFLIPVGIAISPAVMAALFHTGAVIVVAGTGYVIATQANKHRSKNKKKYNHFQAVIKKGGVYVGKGLSKSQAIARMKSKKDIWSISYNQAKGVAAGANRNGKPIHEVDLNKGKPKKGYYYHWHPYKRTPKAHSFYGGPVK